MVNKFEQFGEIASPDAMYPCVGCQTYLEKKKCYYRSDDLYFWLGRVSENSLMFIHGWYCEKCLKKFRALDEVDMEEPLTNQLFIELACRCQEFHEYYMIHTPDIEKVAELYRSKKYSETT